jgi:hypothetical protein
VAAKASSLLIVVDAVDERIGAQKHFNNVNSTRAAATHSEDEWRRIEQARQTSIDVN